MSALSRFEVAGLPLLDQYRAKVASRDEVLRLCPQCHYAVTDRAGHKVLGRCSAKRSVVGRPMTRNYLPACVCGRPSESRWRLAGCQNTAVLRTFWTHRTMTASRGPHLGSAQYFPVVSPVFSSGLFCGSARPLGLAVAGPSQSWPPLSTGFRPFRLRPRDNRRRTRGMNGRHASRSEITSSTSCVSATIARFSHHLASERIRSARFSFLVSHFLYFPGLSVSESPHKSKEDRSAVP